MVAHALRHASPLDRWFVRWGFVLALLAVASALLAPVARLAAEVATGKLGSLCISTAVYGADLGGDSSPDAPPASSADPCHGCISSLTPLPVRFATTVWPNVAAIAAAGFVERLAQRPEFERPQSHAPPAAGR